MKLPGRLLGNFKWIDWVIVALLVVGIAYGTASYRILSTPPFPTGKWGMDDSMVVVCAFDFLKEETALAIRPGDRETDAAERTVAEILEVFPPEPSPRLAHLGGEIYLEAELPESLKRVVARVRLHGELSKDDGRFYFKRKPLSNGSTITLRTSDYSVSGKILPGLPIQVYALVRGGLSSPEMIQLFKPGDRIFDSRGGPSGRVVGGGILARPRQFPRRVFAVTIAPKDPMQISISPSDTYQVNLWVELDCWSQEGGFYYDQKRLKVGDSIVLRTDLYNFSGEVIQISQVLPEEALRSEERIRLEERYVRLRLSALEPEVQRLISPQDPILDPQGAVIGEILRVLSTPRRSGIGVGIDPQGFLKVAQDDRSETELWVKLRLHSDGSQLFLLGGETLKIGQLLLLRSRTYDLEGQVVEIAQTAPAAVSPPAGTVKKILILVDEVPPELLRAVRPEDPILNHAQQVVGRIVAAEDLGPVEAYEWTDRGGALALIRQGRLHRLRVHAEVQAGEDERFRIGEPVRLNSHQYVLLGRVIEVASPDLAGEDGSGGNR